MNNMNMHAPQQQVNINQNYQVPQNAAKNMPQQNQNQAHDPFLD